MKLTQQRLKEIIKEEIIKEGGYPAKGLPSDVGAITTVLESVLKEMVRFRFPGSKPPPAEMIEEWMYKIRDANDAVGKMQ
jgi:hypothetical protein|tara:strand:- start:351 stop:590 length:240 start_codon:yes stop_codon:yes gene_type:complete